MKWLRLLCLLLFVPVLATAHQSGNSYLRISSDAQGATVQLDFAVRDLNSLLQIPAAEQKEITRDQLANLQTPLASLIGKSLEIEVDGKPLALAFRSQEVTLHNDGLYVRQLHVAQPFARDAAYLLVRYGFFNEEEKIARAFLKLTSGDMESTAVLDARHAVQRLPLREIALTEALWTYAREGTLHIWSGLDHVLFLLCLLLPGLSLCKSGIRPLLVYALKVITAFTLAHSVTLAAAALDWIALPDKLIESVIAASIMVSALINLRQSEGAHQWKLALGFGLIHGMGFANGLRELGLSSSHFIETLLAFNVGVEFGQIVVVSGVGLLLLPVLGQPSIIRWIQRWGSAGILVTASIWLVERLL